MGSPPLSLIKKQVRESKVYMLPDIDYRVKVNQNENPRDLPESVKREVTDALLTRRWNRYPGLTSPEIRTQIGKTFDLSMEKVAVGNGSNEIMLATMQMLLGEGWRLLTIEPTFSLYRHYGELLGADVTVIPLKERFAFPVDELIEMAAGDDVPLTILCSPNNPTGNTIAQEDLKQLLSAANGYVLVDEAYVDFSDQEFFPLLGEFPNLILTRTFSKAFAFGFGRFGYVLASPEYVNELYKVLLPYNLGGLTGVAASILLEKRNQLQPLIQDLRTQRESFFRELASLRGITAFPSEANYILIRPEMSADVLFEALLDTRILVRNVSHYPGLGNHLRISVGTQKENRVIIDAMKSILS